MKHVQFHENLLQANLTDVKSNFLEKKVSIHYTASAKTKACLHSHGHICRAMVNTADNTVLTTTEVTFDLKLIHVNLKATSIAEINALLVKNGLAIKIELPIRVTVTC